MVQLEYGFVQNTRKLTHISHVKSGSSCNCVCPACGEKLIARKGDVNAHHFAHQNLEDCEHLGETIVHLLAKEVIQDTPIFIPEYFNRREPDPFIQKAAVGRGVMRRFFGKFYTPINTRCEFRQGSFIPDVTCNLGGRKFFLEFAFTHFMSEEKKQKIRNSEVSCLEINLKHIKRTLGNSTIKAKIKDVLTGQSKYYKKWIHCEQAEEELNDFFESQEYFKACQQSLEATKTTQHEDLNVRIKRTQIQCHTESIARLTPPPESVQRFRAKYAQLEPLAFREFNRRLKSHRLSPHEWDSYLNNIIATEELGPEKPYVGYESWLLSLQVQR